MATGATDQLRLVVWKDLLLRKRRPVILCLEILWPVAIFLLLVILRLISPATRQDACYYNARALPSAGGLRLLQGLICNIDNQCLNRSQYEDIPTYPGSRLDSLVGALSPLFNNEKLLALARELPTSARLLDAISNLLTHQSVKKLLVTGVPVESLVLDAEEMRALLLSKTSMSPEVVDSFLKSKLSLPSLVYALITKHAECDEELIRSIVLSDDSRVAEELQKNCLPDPELKEQLQLLINVEEITQTLAGVAEALDQPRLGSQIGELTEIFHLGSELNFAEGNGSKWSEVVRLASQVLQDLRSEASVPFLRQVWSEWGKSISAERSNDVDIVLSVLDEVFHGKNGSSFEQPQMAGIVVSLKNILQSFFSGASQGPDSFVGALSGTVADLAEKFGADPDWLNIAVHFAHAEASTISSSHSFPYLPRLIEAAALTLADPDKQAKFLGRRQNSPVQLESSICDPDVFEEFVVHSGEARILSKYTCALLTQVVPSLVDKIAGKTEMKFQDAASTPGQKMLSAVGILLQALPKASLYDFREKSDAAVSSLDYHLRHDLDETARAALVASSVQLAYDYLGQLRPDYKLYVDRIAAAVSSLLDILNRALNEANVSGEFSLSSALGLQSLQRAWNDAAENVDSLLTAVDAVLTRGLNATTLAQGTLELCSESSPSSAHLIVDDPRHFVDLEQRICTNIGSIVPEMTTSAPLKEILSIFGQATLSNVSDNSASWPEIFTRALQVKSGLIAFINPTSLSQSLEPLDRFISGLRVLLAVPSTSTEALRLRSRALEIALNGLQPGQGLKSVIEALIDELAETSRLRRIPNPSSSILRWSEENLATFVGLFLKTVSQNPDKVAPIFQSDLDGFCLLSVGNILDLDTDRGKDVSERFSDLCGRLLSIRQRTRAELPLSVTIRKLLDEAVSFWNLVKSEKIESQLLNATLWQTAWQPLVASSANVSVADLYVAAIAPIEAFLPLKTRPFELYNCGSHRAYHSMENPAVRNGWSLLQGLGGLVESAAETFFKPNRVKRIAPLIKSWTTKSGFCAANPDDFQRLDQLLGNATATVRRIQGVLCASTSQIAKEFSACSPTKEVPPTSTAAVIRDAVGKLSSLEVPLQDEGTLSVDSWSQTVLGLTNVLQNGLTSKSLATPQAWIELIDKELSRYPETYSAVRNTLLKTGELSARLLTQNPTQSPNPFLLSALEATNSTKLLETSMWFLSAVPTEVFDFKLESFEALLFSGCEKRGPPINRFLCREEVRSFFDELQTAKLQKPDESLAQAFRSIISFFDRISPESSLALRKSFATSGLHFQRRLLPTLARGVMSTLWLSEVPLEFRNLVEFASTFTEVVNVLPSRTVSNFLAADLRLPSADLSNLPVVDDERSRQFLIENLVPIVGDVGNTGTMLVNLWNSQGLLIRATLGTATCATSTKSDSIVSHLLENLESPTKTMCDAPKTNIRDFYRFFSDNVLQKIQDVDFKDICHPKLLSQFASWSRLNPTDVENFSQCFTDFHIAPVTDELGEVAKSAVDLLKFIAALSRIRKSTSLKDFDPLESLRRELPVFARFENIVFSNNLPDDLARYDPQLKDMIVNTNWLSHHRSVAALKEVFCKESASPVFRFSGELLPKSFCSSHFAKRVLQSIDFERLGPEVNASQNETLFRGLWLRPLLNSEVFLALEKIAGQALPFIQLSEEPLTVDSATALMVSLKQTQLNELHSALQLLESAISEGFTGSEVDAFVRAVRRATGAVAEMSSTGLFDVRFKVSEVLSDVESARKAIMEALGATGYFVDFILSLEFDISSFLVDLSTRKLTFADVVGNLPLLKRAFNLPPSSILFDKYSKMLKKAVNRLGIPPNPLVTVAQQKLLKNVVDILLEKALKKNDLSWDHLVALFSAFNVAPQVVSDVENSFAVIKDAVGLETIKGLSNLDVSMNGVRALAEPVALKLIGRLTCGRPLRDLEQEFKLLQPSNKEPQLNEQDIEELPEEFCRNGYEQVMRLTGGPIIWGFLKPILRGKVLYAPHTEEARVIVTELNRTFESIEHFRDRLQDWVDASNGLKMMLGRKHAITAVKEALFSEVLEPIMKKILPGGVSEEAFDFERVENEVGDAGGLVDMLQLVGNISHCFTLDRFEAVATEKQLEILAPKMTKRKEFLAALVFDTETAGKRSNNRRRLVGDEVALNRSERGFWEMIGFVDDESESRLPHEIRYKIRMDVDNVALTHRIKDLFWKAGPKADFFEDMRYQRGFSQMQQILDAAIINVLNRQVHNDDEQLKATLPATFVQQFPYPCYENDEAGHLLKSIVPVACLLSWLFCVVFLIRQRVLDREQHLQEVLAVMGLKAWVDLAAWILLSGAILGGIVLVSTGLISIILPNSDLILLFAFYSAFALSLLSFCYMVSNLFQHNATLAALAGTLLYIISFIPFVVALTSEASLSFKGKILLCTSMSSAFCYGSLYVTRFEQQTLGLNWKTAFTSPIAGDEMNFMFALAMLLLDAVVYAIIGWYCEHVFNNNLNLRKKWYFVFQSEFWTGNYASDDDLFSIDEKSDGVDISNLLVRYSSGNIAVNKLSLVLKDGEITSLLGQNGAGKTTTIRVLTGQCRATSGRVLAYGIDSRNLPELRRLIGYCPQYNTLFDKLTVREHLQFFARLKCPSDTPKLEIDSEVAKMLQMMDLGHVENRLSSELSGGLQRRLCVGLSFIGGSRLIILDEPTSSVDPVARRHIWDLVLKYRQRRTILLTTHHMDEADILSDRVAVIHRGSLVCQGSPITLKTRFGCGYQLTLCRNSSRESDSGLSTSDTSLTSNHFSVDIIDDIREFVPSATVINDEADAVTVNLPHRSDAGDSFDFATFFKKLDSSGLLAYHGFSNYRVTCTTLEDAFLNLSSNTVPSSITRMPDFDSDTGAGGSDGSASPVWDSGSTSSLYLTSNQRIQGVELTFIQLRALLTKHALHSIRSWKVLFSSVVMPCIFIALAMGITTLKPNSLKEPALDLSMDLYGTPALSVLRGHEERPLMKEFMGEHAVRVESSISPLPEGVYCSDVDRAWKSLDWNSVETLESFNRTQELFVIDPSEVDLADYLLATYAEFADKRYGGWSLDGEHVKVWYDNKAHHSLPIYQNQLTNAVLRKHFGNYTIRAVNHPLHQTQEQLGRETFLSRLADLGVALIIFTGLGFIPASAVIYVVRERAQEEKTVQHCSGVSKPMYWTAIMLWDVVVLLVGILLCSLVVRIFAIPVYVDRDNFPAVVLLFLLFGFSSLSVAQILSHLFNEPSIAFMVTYCLNLFLGLGIVLVLLLSNSTISRSAHLVGLCIPQYAFVEGILVLFKNHLTADIYELFDQDVYEDPLYLLSANYFVMFIVGCCGFLLNIVMDNCNMLSLPTGGKEPEIPHNDDADVVMERKRVVSAIGDDVLSLVNLTKDYKTFGLTKPNRAVDSVSFGIGKGVCFGLLGLNGAGKTTLFKILTGHIRPTSGRAFLKEKGGAYRSLGEFNHHVGYCPQGDAVDDLLTPKQQLTIYAQLKGIPKSEISDVVGKAMAIFQLQAFADRPCVDLSRGTRRKVCTAMAFLGDPQLVLLDEPTTGMDPLTRRLLWSSVQKCVESGRSVLLTSHSMEECEALCNRVGIMANGRLRCIGCPDALKYRFSQGYTLGLRIAHGSEQGVLQYIKQKFSSARVKALHATSLQICVSSKEATLSSLFALLQDERSLTVGILDHTTQLTSLDQVFVEFVSRQRGEEDEEESFSRVATVSSFGSASYQQLSSRDGVPAEDALIDCTHF